jgi:hypothetical protein
MMDFDPMRDVHFRGKAIADLPPEETRDALVSALRHIHDLELGHMGAAQRVMDRADEIRQSAEETRQRIRRGTWG